MSNHLLNTTLQLIAAGFLGAHSGLTINITSQNVMNKGINLVSLAQQLQSDAAIAKDFVGHTSKMRMTPAGDLTLDQGSSALSLHLTGIAHRQVADRMSIPYKYYDRMRADAPDLLATNVNRWFDQTPANRMVRTHGDTARAFLSDSYRPLDNVEVASAILPKLIESGLEVVSSQITDRRLYIQARNPRMEGEVKKGDVIQSGLVISNSEVGHGSLAISELDFRLICLNGMVGQDVVRQVHAGGGRKGNVTFAAEVFKTETRQAADRAFWMEARDAVDDILSRGRFDRRLDIMKRAAGVEITKPQKAIDKVVEIIPALTQVDGESILDHLARGGDMSQWGIANAVTAMAHDESDYDRSVEFERLGNTVVQLPARTFADL